MKKVAFFSKRLDNSNGTVKDCPINDVQTASQTSEPPVTVKKAPLDRKGLGEDGGKRFAKDAVVSWNPRILDTEENPPRQPTTKIKAWIELIYFPFYERKLV